MKIWKRKIRHFRNIMGTLLLSLAMAIYIESAQIGSQVWIVGRYLLIIEEDKKKELPCKLKSEAHLKSLTKGLFFISLIFTLFFFF